ncbi:hypothetical protein V6N12_002608 [Hibiscus sabdariffa]|uniref:Uncharacterized protein n=1 Tax=Hibiscus sabdariffa TaxID=183260 RepID=A0ABR2EB05_9ROSI
MNQARLDYCSVGFNCQCFNYASASTICPDRITKGMSRQRQRVLPGQLLGTSSTDKLSPSNADVTGIPSSQPTLFAASSYPLKLSCYLSLGGESRQVLHSVALADYGSLVWNCISTALLCFDLLLLPYVVHLILNLPRLRVLMEDHNGQNPADGQKRPPQQSGSNHMPKQEDYSFHQPH